jgi:DNA-directed RNA polymerase subunit alpha
VAELSSLPRGLTWATPPLPPPRRSSTSTCPSKNSTCHSQPQNCLRRAQIDTIGQLIEQTEDDLLAITNFGQKSLEEVVQQLNERGLSLRMKE